MRISKVSLLTHHLPIVLISAILTAVIQFCAACSTSQPLATTSFAPSQAIQPYLAHPLDPPPEVTVHIQPVAPAPKSRIVMMEVTAYCPCKVCCGRRTRGITASGKTVRSNGGAFVAADTDLLPFHTRIRVPGYHAGKAIPVLDRGGDITGHRLDVFFRTHAQAETWGRKNLPVTILE